MSIDVNEMFESMTEGIDLGLTCDPHDDGEQEHKAVRLFELDCCRCGYTESLAVCEDIYLTVVARKNDKYLPCSDCETQYKPFDLIQSARLVTL